MQKNKINSLVVALGIILTLSLAFFFIIQISQERDRKSMQEVAQKNITEINRLKQEVEQNNEYVDPTWQKYTNNELGISFQYPTSWGDVKLQYVDETMSSKEINGPIVRKGKGVYVSFIEKSTYILLASSDFNQFLIDSYNGGKDLSLGCASTGEVYENTGEGYDRSYCKDIVVAGQKTYGYYKHHNMECSGDNLWYHLPVNLPQGTPNYTGLQVNYSINFPIDETDFSDPCGRTPENIKANLEAINKRENLNDKILQTLTEYDKFLASFQFLE